ncbi:MAG TPA: HEAT repeat domain-containing protein, partial [Vicinamibacteria bacterium]
MKATSTLLLTLLLSASLLLAGEAPSRPALAARVTTVLGRFPAETSAARDALSGELLALGPGAVAEVCARVQPAGNVDDSRARFALTGLAVPVTRRGAEAERASFARSLEGCLERAKDGTVAAFFLSQLQEAARPSSIPAIRKHLVDEALAGPAAAALVSIGGEEAAKALRGSLAAAPAAARPVLLQALGAMRSRTSVRALLPYADSADGATRQAALHALANIGDPAAGPLLARTRVAAPARERAQAPSLYLLYARRLVESGRTAEGLEVARSLLESYRRPDESAHASAALALLADGLGERVLADLLAAAASPDRALRGAALALAAKVPGSAATARWVEVAEATPSEVRADMV